MFYPPSNKFLYNAHSSQTMELGLDLSPQLSALQSQVRLDDRP